jgi:serine phosphatase RsbU (regulator of sigma subunit)
MRGDSFPSRGRPQTEPPPLSRQNALSRRNAVQSELHNRTVAASWDTLEERAGLLASDALASLDALAAVLGSLAGGEPLRPALVSIAGATAAATRSDLVVVRGSGESGELVALAVAGQSDAACAELEGSHAPVAESDVERIFEVRADGIPAAVSRAAAQVAAEHAAVVPAPDSPHLAVVELYRREAPFEAHELAFARLAAGHASLALAFDRARESVGASESRARVRLELAATALAAGSDEAEAAEQVARLACEVSGARAAILWRVELEGEPAFLAAHGLEGDHLPDFVATRETVARAVAERSAPSPEQEPSEPLVVALGEPPVGALQLLFDAATPSAARADLAPLASRAAVALRRTRRAQVVSEELGRSQTLIAVVGQAIAQLSLTHTLETAVERVVELTGGGEVAVYLREGERLGLAASSGELAGGHEELAERLLELALGPSRPRGFVVSEDTRRDPRLAGLESVIEEAGIRRVLLVPLAVQDEPIGALAVYRRRPRLFREGEESLLLALSGQLAVAVQNARLHERTKELGSVLERALASERKAARQLRGLFEISHSFTRSLSLEATLEAVARTVVELFDLDAAAIRLLDQRGEALEARSVYVADPRLREAADLILSRPQPMSDPAAQRLLRSGRPVLLRPAPSGRRRARELLEPFLAKGSSAAIVPVATPGEALGTLTLLSLDPGRPLDEESVEAASTIAAQAALAIENARLYQQRKDFSETMQRSLLPQELPEVEGVELGHVYDSSARVEVGGDLYDFLVLDDGRLAVVLGDVTGKGIQAAADMAMAKFSFRALARSHPEPGDFLATANQVVVDEIEVGKFITMLYVLVDPERRLVACASAGHHPIRLVRTDGRVDALGRGGLALGIDPGQEYVDQRIELEPGAAVVLYTDGVVEARRNGELYGEERLDAFLGGHAGEGPQRLAEGLLADCRSFSGGELADDCAVVVLRLAR